MLCRLLLAAVLTGGVFVSCEGGDHQTPPPLSGNGGTGGNEPDGGDEPSGSDGYPAGLTVEAFADDLSGTLFFRCESLRAFRGCSVALPGRARPGPDPVR